MPRNHKRAREQSIPRRVSRASEQYINYACEFLWSNSYLDSIRVIQQQHLVIVRVPAAYIEAAEQFVNRESDLVVDFTNT